MSADEIAERQRVGRIFRRISPAVYRGETVHRVNGDLSEGMLRELDQRTARLNISRQAVIKTLLHRALQEDRLGKRRPSRG
jgi:hypothetical protein